jgi:hypothetical protein
MIKPRGDYRGRKVNEERPQYMFVHIAGRDWRRVEEDNIKGTHALLLIYFPKEFYVKALKKYHSVTGTIKC